MQKKIFIGIQVLAGLMLVVFGSNKFFGFISMAPPAPEMGAFVGALFSTGYMKELVAVIEILAGVAFLANKYAALLAVVLMPVMLNALLAHLFLDPAGMGGALVLTLLTVGVMYTHREQYTRILQPN
ncbi:MAG: hypothetical protein OEW60_04090 [Thiovulaceae bacterium]|nr:hypothetical protein [Sulfurimonadaceae bacterium]